VHIIYGTINRQLCEACETDEKRSMAVALQEKVAAMPPNNLGLDDSGDGS
jgi:hypothetical protein